jgi:hypothetical protein
MLTERLALRRFTSGDAANLLSLDGDPQVMRFLTGTTRSLAQIRGEALPDLMGCHLRFPGFGYWAAETLAGGQFIGWFGLRPVRPADAPSSTGPTLAARPASPASVTGCAAAPGGTGMPPRARGPWCAWRSPASGCARSWPPPWR